MIEFPILNSTSRGKLVKKKLIKNQLKKTRAQYGERKISKENALLRLPYDLLRTTTSNSLFSFETTDEIQDLTDFVGQRRALDAVQFGIEIKSSSHNLYAMGPPGVGKRSIIQTIIETQAMKNPVPSDWCYVNNFKDAKKPIALRLPPGQGCLLKLDMEKLIEELSNALPIMFESEEFRTRIKNITDEFNEKQDKILKEIEDEAKKLGLTILFYPQNFSVFSVDENGEIITEEKFSKLSVKERKEKQALINEFSSKIPDLLKKVPIILSERKEQEKAARNEFTLIVVDFHIKKLKEKYSEYMAVVTYLTEVQEDIVQNVKDFLKKDTAEAQFTIPYSPEKQAFIRYQVNVMVDNTHAKSAPVVYEELPTYSNLICRIEHTAQFGALFTDFTLIRPGSLHKANGGYLIIDMLKLLKHPFAWEGLKHVLISKRIFIQPPERMLGLFSTVSLEPEPIPLDIKVVLLGERYIYYLLNYYDDDFGDLFKVVVDFDEEMDRDTENVKTYAQLIATLSRKNNLKPFNREAVILIIDHCSRLADDAKKLSIHMRSVDDLIRESSYWAEKNGSLIVDRNHVKEAIQQQIYRLDRVRDLIYEQIQRNILLIQTEGNTVGQINALSVVQIGSFRFAFPTKITARVRLGEGKIIDIQREVHLGGPLHSKGVMTLSGFLLSRYVPEDRFSLSATLVFEQSYGMVDGDSASLAELCIILSAIADIPLNQAIAMTGSVNQQGMVQPIGGVNEKIEGFFDICKRKGFAKDQAVIIPKANECNLMLREDIVESVRKKKFHIYSVENVDQAIQILTGMEAGVRGINEIFPRRSFNGHIEQILARYTKRALLRIKRLRKL